MTLTQILTIQYSLGVVTFHSCCDLSFNEICGLLVLELRYHWHQVTEGRSLLRFLCVKKGKKTILKLVFKGRSGLKFYGLLLPWAQFHRAASAQKEAKLHKIMLTTIRLTAKLPCHMYNLWLVSCSVLRCTQLLNNIFGLNSTMKLGLVFGLGATSNGTPFWKQKIALPFKR